MSIIKLWRIVYIKVLKTMYCRYGYAIASALHGVQHILRKDFMIQVYFLLFTSMSWSIVVSVSIWFILWFFSSLLGIWKSEISSLSITLMDVIMPWMWVSSRILFIMLFYVEIPLGLWMWLCHECEFHQESCLLCYFI